MCMDELLTRVTQVEANISQVKNKVAYRDLRQMLATVDAVITEISRESVKCRQRKRPTVKYQELCQQADALLTNLEHHVVFAALLK